MRLRCTSGSLSGEVYELDSRYPYLFGRETSETDSELIVLPSPTVSRKHCKIIFENGSAIIEDLNSANGIRVNRKRINRATLKNKDLLQIGAFSFTVEDQQVETSDKSEPQTGKKAAFKIDNPKLAPYVKKLNVYWAQFERLDLKYRALILLMLGGVIIHFGITYPLISEARLSLLEESFSTAETAVRSLADHNKRELAEGSYYVLDCEFLKRTSGVIASQLFDAKGRMVCPIGKESVQDELMEGALYRGDAKDNCQARMIQGSESDCDFVFPIREWKDQQGQYITVGVARVKYSPKDADLAVQNLQSLKFKSLVFCLLLLGLIWWFWQLWTRKEIAYAAEGTHLAVTGAHKEVINLESFAALDPLIQEINRLISKENQGLAAKSADISEEASFLHSLLQQVLLLEERAVMVVDKDNQLIAASRSLPEAVPVEVSRMNIHITEAVADTHLQGELILLLNDLAQSNEVIDRPLAMADRVLQTRGMPIYLREDFVASILIF